jgi:hypothetical protein
MLPNAAGAKFIIGMLSVTGAPPLRVRQCRLVGARRRELARGAAEKDLYEAAAILGLTGLGIARPVGGGLRLSLHCCRMGALMRRESAGKELERVGQSRQARRAEEKRRNEDTPHR